MEWHQCPEIETYEGVWLCSQCRCLPKTISAMKIQLNDLAILQSTNSELVRNLTKLTEEIISLRSENVELRRLVEDGNSSSKLSNLLVGSSHLKRLDTLSPQVVIEAVSGGKVQDATKTLKSLPDNYSDTVTIVSGSNDCASSDPCESIVDQFKTLGTEAKRVAKKTVAISSVLPRLTSDEYTTRADHVNEHLQTLCREQEFKFINNDDNFRLLNGQVDDSLICRDKVHLTDRGSRRLVKNLDLEGKVRVTNFSANSFAAAVKAKPLSRQAATVRDTTGHPPSLLSLKTFPPRDAGKATPGVRSSRTVSRTLVHATSTTARDDACCYFCGERGHVTDVCRHGRVITCNKCGRGGHKAKHCHNSMT